MHSAYNTYVFILYYNKHIFNKKIFYDFENVYTYNISFQIKQHQLFICIFLCVSIIVLYIYSKVKLHIYIIHFYISKL